MCGCVAGRELVGFRTDMSEGRNIADRNGHETPGMELRRKWTGHVWKNGGDRDDMCVSRDTVQSS
jgi:hypothetical protein